MLETTRYLMRRINPHFENNQIEPTCWKWDKCHSCLSRSVTHYHANGGHLQFKPHTQMIRFLSCCIPA